MRPVNRPGLAALVDLGLSDDILARYLRTDVATVVALRSRYGISEAVSSPKTPLQSIAPPQSIATRNEAPRQAAASDAAIALVDKAEQWRMRAEEYWAVSGSMRTPLARNTYAHLARSYQRLAERFEARARDSMQKQRIG